MWMEREWKYYVRLERQRNDQQKEKIGKAGKEDDKRKRVHASSKITADHPGRRAAGNRTEAGKRESDSDRRGTRANHNAWGHRYEKSEEMLRGGPRAALKQHFT